ncbi:peroxidase family protein [Microbacterium thalassium]|uniref:Peroxidase n=1 Tax=Microbacterium thalassium TaxID=362649 RepID=A0A7X0FS74_9MICO|nr:heme peroxidase family protein [Microbacterium thalassium]MBB6392750.1 hypothetical protein [Microbacterium thalassium]
MSDVEHHGMKKLEGIGRFYHHHDHTAGGQRDDRFGRMFPNLPAAYVPAHILSDIGKSKGPMDGKSLNDRTDSVAAGVIFFGQFVDHDITLDTTTTFDSVIDQPGEIANVRTPVLDLDCIYGSGPEAQPYMYDQAGASAGAKLLTGADNPGQGGQFAEDLLRGPNGRAMIGDPRNDENRVVSQLQLAIIRFHNHVCDTLHAEEGYAGSELYEHARRVCTWHYQWAVVNDLLTAVCGKPVVDRILGSGRKHYRPDVPYIPVEFSVAAYRFGHSMIPMKVQVQQGASDLELFGPTLGRGFAPLSNPAGIVDWDELIDTPAAHSVARAQKLDTKLAGDLLKLPFVTTGEASLATRNLLRGNAFKLPGGEQVAEAMACDPAQIEKVTKKVATLSPKLSEYGIPLWLYILAEAEVIGRAEPDGSTKEGEGLGPVGATIVAETIIGLLELDDTSFLGANRNWGPREEWNTLGKICTV